LPALVCASNRIVEQAVLVAARRLFEREAAGLDELGKPQVDDEPHVPKLKKPTPRGCEVEEMPQSEIQERARSAAQALGRLRSLRSEDERNKATEALQGPPR